MNNNEINPRLKKQLESLQDIPERDFLQSHRGKEVFLTQAKSLKPRQAPKSPRKVPRSRSWVPRLASILAVLLIALFSIGGTVYAAQGSLPDDLLYPVKTLTEDIQIGLESDPQDRLDLHASFASRRLEEIQAQVDAGEEVSDKALARLEKHTEKMLREAAQLGEQGLENALQQIQQNLMKQNQMMEKLQKETPGHTEKGLNNAQEKIQSRLELVENGIQEPQGFREKIRNENAANPEKGNQKDKENNKPETPPGLEGKEDKGTGNGNGNNNDPFDPTQTTPENGP